MYPHHLRLRGPWHLQALANPEPIQRVTMPCHWSTTGVRAWSGPVRCLRRFGYPGKLEECDRVWLAALGLPESVFISINGHHLHMHKLPIACESVLPVGKVVQVSTTSSAIFSTEAEITSLLKPRNELCIDLEIVAETGWLWQEIALEIRCTAYLQQVHACLLQGQNAETRLYATGTIVGQCERALDLYLLLDDKTVAYRSLLADEAGVAFELVSEPLPTERWDRPRQVRVELVNGATVWYRVELTMTPTTKGDLPSEAEA